MSGEHLDGATLAAFAGGTLDDEEADVVRRHLADCSECSERLRVHKETAALVSRAAGSRLPDDVPAVADRASGSAEHPDAETLAAYSDGSLPEDAVLRVERHLAVCGDCLREVADLWAMSSERASEPPSSALVVVRARLARDAAGGAVVRLVGRAVQLVRDFGEALGVAAETADAEPAFAHTRSAGDSVELSWSGGDDVELRGRIDVRDGEAHLLGRLTVAGEPGVALSVALVAGESGRGPESTDREGRFGPWRLAFGENTIILSGSALGAEAVRLPLEVLPG